MYIDLCCSNCGNHRRLSADAVQYTVDAIKQGWGSYGAALYCPECVRTWYDRNTRPMADERNTMLVIMGQIWRAREAAQ